MVGFALLVSGCGNHSHAPTMHEIDGNNGVPTVMGYQPGGTDQSSNSGIPTPQNPNPQSSAVAGQASGTLNLPCTGSFDGACGPQEYCAFQPGQFCGAQGDSATCKPRPLTCPIESNPVCGCNAVVYPNACEANSAGVGLLSFGPCDPSNGLFGP
jgi:hypothetical protein